jgi:neutral ceramidase
MSFLPFFLFFLKISVYSFFLASSALQFQFASFFLITDSGPGGFHEYLLYDITSMGYIDATAQAMVAGIVQSIRQAHHNLQPTRLTLIAGDLYNANINRSPTAHDANSLEERAEYGFSNTDTRMTLLKLDSESNSPRAMVSWFAVHCTSMNNTNRLVSGDNKGYASYLFEREMNNLLYGEDGTYTGSTWRSRAEKGDLFVAAFAQSNEVTS